VTRNNLKVEPGGFVEYGAQQLPKVDAMRRDKSQPDFYGIPIIHDAQVLYTTGEELGGKPASCYTCKEHTADLTCERLGQYIKVQTVTGSRKSGEPITYWPCCSLHEYTETPRQGKVEYHDVLDKPNAIGLIWINAPKPNQKFGGANCGGVNGGDDCDAYLVKSGEKWDNPQGFCRVLQHTVDADAVCTAWNDDDILLWEDAERLIKGESLETVEKRKVAKSIIGRDDD
jgi:hypothetical protein